VTKLQAGWSWVRVPLGTRDFSLLQNVKTGCGTNPAPCSPRAEVRSEWGYTSTSPTWLHVVVMEDFTFSWKCADDEDS